jgi:tRNA(adenine34) deaminase
MTDDERFMREAIREALDAREEDEVPVGCVIVHDGRIIGRGHNRVESLKDPTAHAEILAIGAAATCLDNWRLEGATAYVTQEPCLMCAGAFVLARVDEVVYALPDPKFGAIESLYELPLDRRLNHRVRARRGPFREDIEQLVVDFFKARRESKDEGI